MIEDTNANASLGSIEMKMIVKELATPEVPIFSLIINLVLT